MTFQESEAMRKQQKRDNQAALEAFRIASAERIAAAADNHARVLRIVVAVCALVCVAAAVA